MVLAAKKNAHVVIDECVTGGYHKSSLEGLSVGAFTICYLTEDMQNLIKKITGSNELPWINSTIENLYQTLEDAMRLFYDNINEFQRKRSVIREWVETYWNPQDICEEYSSIYYNELNIDTNPWANLTVSGNLEKVRELRANAHKQYDGKKKALFFKKLEGYGRGKKVLLLGNGRSIDKVDLNKKIESVDEVFTCNYFFNLKHKIDPTFWFCVDNGAIAEGINNVSLDTKIVAQPPMNYIDIPHDIIWIDKNIDVLNKHFSFKYEIERAHTVAEIMMLYAMYMRFDEIYTLGIDLNIDKKANNYAYKNNVDANYHNKFRPFNVNYNAIIKEFRLMKEEARMLGIKIRNLDPSPRYFDVFEVER